MFYFIYYILLFIPIVLRVTTYDWRLLTLFKVLCVFVMILLRISIYTVIRVPSLADNNNNKA